MSQHTNNTIPYHFIFVPLLLLLLSRVGFKFYCNSKYVRIVYYFYLFFFFFILQCFSAHRPEPWKTVPYNKNHFEVNSFVCLNAFMVRLLHHGSIIGMFMNVKWHIRLACYHSNLFDSNELKKKKNNVKTVVYLTDITWAHTQNHRDDDAPS